jgi:hypothetical protein
MIRFDCHAERNEYAVKHPLPDFTLCGFFTIAFHEQVLLIVYSLPKIYDVIVHGPCEVAAVYGGLRMTGGQTDCHQKDTLDLLVRQPYSLIT